MAYTKDLLLQPIPSIRNTRLDTLEDSFISKCEALQTTLFPDPPRTPNVDLLDY
jgi:hypothetical protein